MSLFQIIPSTFFSALASQNKEIYVEALMLLHKMFKYDIHVEVEDYIVSLVSQIEDREFIPEEEGSEQAGSLSTTQRARFILNKLIRTGWVDKEFKDGTFTEVIVLHDYSLKTLNLLEELSHPNRQEYNSLVFSTYSSLKQAKTEEPKLMYEALSTARENTERLIDELKSLYHSIRDYHRAINTADNVNELLKEHFDDYKALIDRIYHPIKTMDSIYRYSQPIIDILSGILADESLLSQMVSRAMNINLEKNEENSWSDIVADIDFIIESFKSIFAILDEIDKKHHAYTRHSIEKMQYLMTADRSIKGKLITILQHYSAVDETGQKEIMQLFKKNIHVDRQETFDGQSLYHKNIRSRRTTAPSLKIKSKNVLFADEAIKSMLNQIKNSYPAIRVRTYMTTLLKGKQSLKMDDISIQSDDDFILLLIGTVRANDQNMPYLVEVGKGEIKKNGYTVPNVVFINKEV